jgi:TIR domain-containing protein
MADKSFIEELRLPEPVSMKRSEFLTVEYGDISSEEAAEHLIHLLWRKPEVTIYYYYPKDVQLDGRDRPLWAAHARRDILMNEIKRCFYKHPHFEHDYVFIVDRDGKYEWEWEKDVVEKGPEYWQVKLELSGRKREKLEIWHKIQLEDEYREKLRKARYSYDVFLSYSSVDQKEAEMIHGLIEKAGGKVFMAPKNLDAGDDFAEEVRSAIEGAKELWLLLTPSSKKSEWVISEWGAAWALRKKIVPIVHRCDIETLPDRLRRLHCIFLHECEEVVRKTFGVPA